MSKSAVSWGFLALVGCQAVSRTPRETPKQPPSEFPASTIAITASTTARAATSDAGSKPVAAPARVPGSSAPLTVAANGIDGRLEVWVDPTYALPYEKACDRWEDDLPPTRVPIALWARLVLVDSTGTEREAEELGDEGMPYAAARIRPLEGCAPITPTFALDVDKSCGMGSYCGPSTQLVRVTNGHIEFVKDQRGTAVAAVNGLKSEYHIEAEGPERRCAFVVKYSRLGPSPVSAKGPRVGDDDFYTGSIRTRETRRARAPSTWVYAEQVTRGLWEAM